MAIVVLGTSNGIVQNSFVDRMRACTDEPVLNLSVGASTSMTGLFLLGRHRLQRDDIAILDYLINDAGSIWHGMRTEADIRLYLSSIIAHVRRCGAVPVMLLLPTHDGLAARTATEALFLDVCATCAVPYLDLSGLFRDALSAGVDHDALMRDPWHAAPRTTPVIAGLILQAVRRLRAAASQDASMTLWHLPTRVIAASDLYPLPWLVSRSSSVYRGEFLALNRARSLSLRLDATESLIGLMLNTGAPGANVAFATATQTMVKSLTIYWNADHPDWFTAIFVDFRTPLAGDGGTIRIGIAAPDAVATDPTHHQMPPLPGREGEVEFEGFLIARPAEQTTIGFRQPGEIGFNLTIALGHGHCLATLLAAAATA